jgi:hypothetical protein
LQAAKRNKLILAEAALTCIIALFVASALVLPNYNLHFHKLTVTYYTDGTMDFSTDATALVRSLGTISLLTLGLGVMVGAAVVLTTSELRQTKKSVSGYENSLVAGGLITVTPTQEGTAYQLTENGRRFLYDYAFLSRTLRTPENLQHALCNES